MSSFIFVLSLLMCQGITCSNIDEAIFRKGHLQPLGSHRPPETDLIDDLQEVPSPKEFWEKYVKPSKAVVLRGAAKHSPAFTKWTDKYLKENFADLEVRVERKKEKSGNIPVGIKGIGRDTIGNFINHYHQTNSYIVSELPTPLWKDIHVQPCIVCGTMGKQLVEVDLWMSGGGSSSILHKDAFNAINCLYNGTKEWKMIEYKYEDKIHKAYEPEREVGGFSRINPLKVDLIKYPKVAEVPWSFITINAGDCLFLPKSYYHQVTSYGTMNVAVAILFSRFDNINDIDFNDCHGNVTYTPLSELDMDWKYPGHGNLSMGNPDLEEIRSSVKHIFKENYSTNKALVNMLKEFYPEKPDKWLLKKTKNILESIGFDGKKSITPKNIEELGRDELRKLALAFEPTDLSNTENHEYTYVDPELIREIVHSLQESDGRMDKQKFIEGYKQGTSGTGKFAKEIITKLSKDSARSWVIKEEILSNLDSAIQPFLENQRERFVPPGQSDPEANDAYDNQSTEHESGSIPEHIEL